MNSETAPPASLRASRRPRRERLGVGARERLLRQIAREALLPEPEAATLRVAIEAVRDVPCPDDPSLLDAAKDLTIDVVPEAGGPSIDPPNVTDGALVPVVSGPTSSLAAPARTGPWGALRPISVDARLLARNLVVAAARTDPAHGAFDVLRTRIVRTLAERGWRRVGITSPTQGCGKSFTALNLAVALSRYEDCRTLLLDMDLRQPSLARTLGIPDAVAIAELLRGDVAPADALRRLVPNASQIGSSLVVGLNGRPEPHAAEVFHDPRTAQALARLEEEMDPDVILFDMPPVLARDDVIALVPHVDCLLMVVGGGQTTAREMREAARRLGEDRPILGVILNKAEGEELGDYAC